MVSRIVPPTPEPVVVGRRRAWTAVEKRLIIDRQDGLCATCDLPLGSDTEFDHLEPRWFKGDDSIENARATHAACHSTKTRFMDIPRIAKTKRQSKLSLAVAKVVSRFKIPQRVNPWPPKGARKIR